MSDTPASFTSPSPSTGLAARPARAVEGPPGPANASIDINYYIRTAQLAEQALFDALFIVDSQSINATEPSHYLNRLEPLTLLSAVATHTSRIGLVGTVSRASR